MVRTGDVDDWSQIKLEWELRDRAPHGRRGPHGRYGGLLRMLVVVVVVVMVVVCCCCCCCCYCRCCCPHCCCPPPPAAAAPPAARPAAEPQIHSFVRAVIQGRDVPTYVVSRHANWGFMMQVHTDRCC